MEVVSINGIAVTKNVPITNIDYDKVELSLANLHFGTYIVYYNNKSYLIQKR